MNLLFVLSQIEVTGAETYALALANALKKQGHNITFVSDTLRNVNPQNFISLPIHQGNTSYFSRFKNVRSLRRIIKQRNIDLIHSHSRAANLVSHFAKGKVPMVVSVHGKWRNHFAFRALPCLGEKTIAVCPYLERYLTQEIGINSARVQMVPNGIDTELFVPKNFSPDCPRLLFVGRFSGQKGNSIRFLIRDIFPQILQQVPKIEIVIASSKPLEQDQILIRQFNNQAGNQILTVAESVPNIQDYYKNATAVLGSGRVAMEAMACAKPVITIGESCAPGLLTPENFDTAFDSNFGDCGTWNLFIQQNNLERDLITILKNVQLQQELSSWGRQKALEFFDFRKVALKVEEVYKNLV